PSPTSSGDEATASSDSPRCRRYNAHRQLLRADSRPPLADGRLPNGRLAIQGRPFPWPHAPTAPPGGAPGKSRMIALPAPLFAAAACHVVAAVLFRLPHYRLATLLEVTTAPVAWVALVALLPLVPRVLALRSPQELEEEVDRRLRQLRDSESRVRAIVETAA